MMRRALAAITLAASVASGGCATLADPDPLLVDVTTTTTTTTTDACVMVAPAIDDATPAHPTPDADYVAGVWVDTDGYVLGYSATEDSSVWTSAWCARMSVAHR